MNVNFNVTFFEGLGEITIEVTDEQGTTEVINMTESDETSLDLEGDQAISLTGESPPGGTTVHITWGEKSQDYSFEEGLFTKMDALILTDEIA